MQILYPSNFNFYDKYNSAKKKVRVTTQTTNVDLKSILWGSFALQFPRTLPNFIPFIKPPVEKYTLHNYLKIDIKLSCK